MMRGKREKALLSAACLAVALLFAACEGELAPSVTGGAASAASAVSAAQQSAPAGESPGGSPFPEGGVQQEDGVSFRLEPYTLQQDGCDFSLTYPQLEGGGYDEVNALLRERGLQLAELLLTEREKEQSAVQSAASSGAGESGVPASSLPEPKPLTLSGSSRCGFASRLFVSATYTADVSEDGGDPTRDWVSLNYDIASGEEVTCADLFPIWTALPPRCARVRRRGTRWNRRLPISRRTGSAPGCRAWPLPLRTARSSSGIPCRTPREMCACSACRRRRPPFTGATAPSGMKS